MTIPTTNMALPKGEGTDNERDYLKGAIAGGGLWSALDTVDGHDHATNAAGLGVRRVQTAVTPAAAGQVQAVAGGLAIHDGSVVRTLREAIGARVYHSLAQSIAHNTVTTLAFDSELWDVDPAGGLHDLVTNNSRITIRTTGRYQIGALARFAASATGLRQLTIMLNGVTAQLLAVQASFGGVNATFVQVHGTGSYVAGDYLELQAYQDSGGALNVLNGSFNDPVFYVEKA